MALLCLGYDPTITNSVWLVKVAIRSRRQSIWVTYTSRRYTAFYTGFRCMLRLYMHQSSSRLACRDIQRIQRIQRIQLYTLYSIQHHTASLRGGEVGGCGRVLPPLAGRGAEGTPPYVRGPTVPLRQCCYLRPDSNSRPPDRYLIELSLHVLL